MIKIYNYELIRKEPEKFQEIFNYIKKYGSHTMAYSTLQPRMNYFIVEGIGFIAYAKYKKTSNKRYVLGDPVCDFMKIEEILKLFLERFPKTTFVQVSQPISKILNNWKFYATPLGIETSIDLNEFNISKGKKKNLRNNIRNCKGKVRVFEDTELEKISLNRIHEISEDWLKKEKKGKKELRFLARPFVSIPEIGTRRFFAFKDDEMIGFIIFNPIYRNRELIGYSSDILRTSSEAPRGTGDFLLYLSMKKLKREGIPILGLGLSPFYGLEKDSMDFSDKPTLFLLKQIYNKGSSLYSFSGLAEHKIQFEGKESNVYFCHRNSFPILDIYKLFRICNAI
ncbi:DUF2156 domain-containing protein [Candidatus Pacearchaeota archaeon]|nr:DUF2156 domain-containing protein [Candidatus Pacearchaeota archaeon]MBD3283744.1 DUF2156 domain-containing protein [Candidatus Pacearchaeota archaeon]